jgi:predicted ester cyclase
MSDASEWVERVICAVNERDWDVVEEALSYSCTYEANGSPAWNLSGRDHVLGRFKALLAAFPDQKAEVRFLVAESKKAAFELHITETHTGPLDTPFGSFPATGMGIDEVVGYFVELDADGRAAKIGHFYDAAPLTMAIMAGQQADP